MIRTLNRREESKARHTARQQHRASRVAQREAKQIVHSANMRNVSAECHQSISSDPDKKIAQGGLPSLGRDS